MIRGQMCILLILYNVFLRLCKPNFSFFVNCISQSKINHSISKRHQYLRQKPLAHYDMRSNVNFTTSTSPLLWYPTYVLVKKNGRTRIFIYVKWLDALRGSSPARSNNGTWQCDTVQKNRIQYNTMQYHTIQWNDMQYHAMKSNKIQNYVIAYNSMK